MSGAAKMDKPAFTRDQMTSSSEAARRLREIRRRAKIEPQVILDNGNLDSVLLAYEQYERLVLRLQQLEEQILVERLERIEQNPASAIPWRKVRRSPIE